MCYHKSYFSHHPPRATRPSTSFLLQLQVWWLTLFARFLLYSLFSHSNHKIDYRERNVIQEGGIVLWQYLKTKQETGNIYPQESIILWVLSVFMISNISVTLHNPLQKLTLSHIFRVVMNLEPIPGKVDVRWEYTLDGEPLPLEGGKKKGKKTLLDGFVIILMKSTSNILTSNHPVKQT